MSENLEKVAAFVAWAPSITNQMPSASLPRAAGRWQASSLRDGRIQTLVHTRFNEMIRMSGRAALVPEDEQAKWADAIFSEQPYLANVYPGETRSICVIFKVEDIVLDYFNLGIRPIERAVFSLARASTPLKGLSH